MLDFFYCLRAKFPFDSIPPQMPSKRIITTFESLGKLFNKKLLYESNKMAIN